MIAERITRPVDTGATTETSARDHLPFGIGSRRPLILVVEDERHEWEIYGKILWYNGYDVMFASEGEEGLRLAREHVPDLVLLDLIMPKLDGMSLCRLLKREAATAHVPIIVLSGRPYHEMGTTASNAGCARYLEKPASPIEVLHHVEELIGRAPLAGEGQPPLKYPPTA